MKTENLNSRLNINVDGCTSYELKKYVNILKSTGFNGCSNGEVISAIFNYFKSTGKDTDFIADILKVYREKGARNDIER